MFRPVPSKISFPDLEKRILHFWREKRIFERSVAERETSPLFVLYEGPPTANASPGVHHILSRVFKDVIPRYKTMRGYCAPRKAGWDTHGLPVELEIERELGFSSKDQIETYGVSQFNARCRESV
ncbi:MAG: class I tRNA ligase family protein, partial [Dehalococcoidia bacterium]|nr:class I tRNA ligase family protein [Dehalococcoidia bacterium]